MRGALNGNRMRFSLVNIYTSCQRKSFLKTETILSFLKILKYVKTN